MDLLDREGRATPVRPAVDEDLGRRRPGGDVVDELGPRLLGGLDRRRPAQAVELEAGRETGDVPARLDPAGREVDVEVGRLERLALVLGGLQAAVLVGVVAAPLGGWHLVQALLLEDAPRHPFTLENGFAERLHDLKLLSDEDKTTLVHVLDALLAKGRIKSFAQGVG